MKASQTSPSWLQKKMWIFCPISAGAPLSLIKEKKQEKKKKTKETEKKKCCTMARRCLTRQNWNFHRWTLTRLPPCVVLAPPPLMISPLFLTQMDLNIGRILHFVTLLLLLLLLWWKVPFLESHNIFNLDVLLLLLLTL